MYPKELDLHTMVYPRARDLCCIKNQVFFAFFPPRVQIAQKDIYILLMLYNDCVFGLSAYAN